MLSWLTGSKLVDTTADLEDDRGLVENTYIDAPETPAHIFPVRAFKYAIFGTPQPGAYDQRERHLPARKPSETPKDVTPRKSEENARAIPSKPEVNSRSMSPTKPGILLTPGTTRGKRKDVTFCVEVVDNEGKTTGKPTVSHTLPGKFPSPSPWASKSANFGEEKRGKTKLTAALYEAQGTGINSKDRTKTRAKDDADITIDIMEPRSESGRYWKEQYMAYSKKSEEETKKLIAKQRLAKEYARKKDDEAVEARQQLEMERRRRHKREKNLEKEVKELREMLRKALGENGKASTEAALLRQQADKADPKVKEGQKLAKETTATTSALPDSIWEDAAEVDEEHARVIPFVDVSVLQTSGSQGQSTRNNRGERKLSRKRGSVSRLDSVLTPSFSETSLQVPNRIPSPTPERPNGARSSRRMLGERSPNIATSSPAFNFHSPGDFNEPPKKSKQIPLQTENCVADNYKPFNPSEFLDSFDAGADYSIIQDPHPLQFQSASKENKAETYPTASPTSATKCNRSNSTVVTPVLPEGILPADRGAAAIARVSERRAQRKKARENTRLS